MNTRSRLRPAHPTYAQGNTTSPFWISKDGRVIQSKFGKVDGEVIVVEMGGKEFTLPFTKLVAKSAVKANSLGVHRPRVVCFMLIRPGRSSWERTRSLTSHHQAVQPRKIRDRIEML